MKLKFSYFVTFVLSGLLCADVPLRNYSHTRFNCSLHHCCHLRRHRDTINDEKQTHD